MSGPNSPTQRERLKGLPTPKEVTRHLNRGLWYPPVVRDILMAYAIGDLVQATEAESAYDIGFEDGMTAGTEEAS